MLLLALVGPQGEVEMRLERLVAADLRRDGTLLLDALKAVGFFPGPRAVLLQDATDGLAPAIAAALDARGPEDARLVVTGAGLAFKGALRKLFEGRRDAAAITLYDDPPTEAELAEMVREAELSDIAPTAKEELWALAQALSVGELRALIERLSLHQSGEVAPLDLATVQALAPQTGDAEADLLLAAVTDGRRDQVPKLFARLVSEGVSPVAVTIQATRHFRMLLAVASDPQGVQSGLATLRPPAGRARRQALARAAQSWRRERIEEAIRSLVALDLELRSGSRGPDSAMLERLLIRLAG